MTQNKRQVGTEWEKIVCQYLENNGYYVLERNYRCKIGEIDIIASKNNSIIFVEVKYRRNNAYGSSIEAVNLKKQQTIRRVAQNYMTYVLHTSNVQCRFDVIGIDKNEITHIEDAF